MLAAPILGPADGLHLPLDNAPGRAPSVQILVIVAPIVTRVGAYRPVPARHSITLVPAGDEDAEHPR
jgi:hypothetical protein